MVLPVTTCLAFLVISAWHFYMAAMPGTGSAWAVPSRDGKPLFRPSRAATAAVAISLLVFAVLVGACARLWPIGVPHRFLQWFSYVLATGLVVRAVGDFRYVGFFKRMRDTPFAKLDSLVFSPVCLLLAAGVCLSALQSDS